MLRNKLLTGSQNQQCQLQIISLYISKVYSKPGARWAQQVSFAPGAKFENGICILKLKSEIR